MARQKLNPDQIPLLTPDSDWVTPKELPDLRRIGEIGLDTETRDDGLASGRGPDWAFGAGYVAGVGAAWREGNTFRKIYVPVRHPDTECFPRDQVARWVTDITRNNRVVFQNAGYDIGWLKTDMDVEAPRSIDDVGCMAVMIDENRRGDRPYSLDSLAEWRGVPGKDTAALREAAVVYGVAAKDAVANIWRLPARYAGPYGEQDPLTTLMLAHDMRPELARQGLMTPYETEMRLVPMVHEMRRRGIRLDLDRIERLRDTLAARSENVLAELGRRLHCTVGMDDIRSNSWLVNKFSQENAPFNKKRNEDTGGETASFEKDWMRASPHWLPRMVAEAKQCREAADKFCQGYLLDYAHNGRVHASINQFRTDDGGTRSHRFSYAAPPLQQMPSRPDPVEGWDVTWEIAREIRSAFLPEPGTLWFSPDYSQQEYRLIVHYAEKLRCTRAGEAADKYRSDPKTDFHNLVVELTGLTRRRAKDVNFAKAFGAGVAKFAAMTGMSLEEARSTMEQYDTEMPFVKELGKECGKKAQHCGFIRMIDGARSHFDQWESAWLEKEERERGWSEGWPMMPCSREEAVLRQTGECPRAYRAEDGSDHPWRGKRLRRAETHKAMNRLIQGSAARQMKLSMATCYEEGYLPMLQMHDELSFSLTDERVGERIAEIMRTSVETNVPMLVDAEWGPNWGEAKHTYAEALKLSKQKPKKRRVA